MASGSSHKQLSTTTTFCWQMAGWSSCPFAPKPGEQTRGCFLIHGTYGELCNSVYWITLLRAADITLIGLRKIGAVFFSPCWNYASCSVMFRYERCLAVQKNKYLVTFVLNTSHNLLTTCTLFFFLWQCKNRKYGILACYCCVLQLYI